MAELYLRDDVVPFLAAGAPEASSVDMRAGDSRNTHEQVLSIAARLDGEVFRAVARRRTVRMLLDGRAYFAKVHLGVGWKEILKNWLVLKPPVLGAENEYRACLHLANAGVRAPVVAGYGMSNGNPAERTSWIVTDELTGYLSLEDLVARWAQHPPKPRDVRKLVEHVARFVREFHGAGVIHRDLYICHILIDEQAWAAGHVNLAVLDLHRAQIHARIPEKWLLRDLAALLFSTLDLGLARGAWLRFVRIYRDRPLRDVFAEEGEFWRRVLERAETLYAKGATKGLVTGDYAP